MPTLPARVRRLLHAGMLLLACAPLALSARDRASGVGFRAISVHDPVSDGAMPGYVFYPATHAAGTTWRGPYEVAASADAPPITGAKPLVVISHGNGGSDLGHHDLATYLASHGFVVATLEHPGDNFHDKSGVGTPAVLAGRPIQVAATISALLADPQWKSLIDPARIGVAGFSAGGYTSLAVIGALPKFSRFLDYCERHAGDPAFCADATRKTAELAAQGRTPQAYMAELQADFGRRGPTADPRVKAAFVMAPIGLLFDAEGLATIDRPVYLAYGEDDHVLPPAENAARIRSLMPTLTGVRAIPKADHWVFLPPCSAALAKDIPDLCRDPPGVDRVREHARIDAEALAFFRKTLAAPH